MPSLFFDIITIFPDMFKNVLEESIVKRAQEKEIVEINTVNPRDFTEDKHLSVDDYLYGGFPGMLLKCEPLTKAINFVKNKRAKDKPKIIYLSPKGTVLNQEKVKELKKEKSIVLICGHYKGIDQRIIDSLVDEEISIGDYVLSGGEIPAMILVDSVTRLLPGALGDAKSAENDSLYNGLLEAPNYTRPEVFEGLKVPEVLLSGHHKKIEEWSQKESEKITKTKRPDLYKKWLDKNKRKLI